MTATYNGPIGFGSDGVHYPLDDEGHLDTSRPLRSEPDGTYRDAEEGEPLHNDVHHVRTAIVDPSTINIHDPGRDVYPVGVHVITDDAVSYYLADEQGNRTSDTPLRWDAETQTFQTQEGST